MGKTDGITERQLTVLIFVSLLSPMIRVLPTAAVMLGGRASWLSPLPALAAGAALTGLYTLLLKNAPAGMGLQEAAEQGLGPVGGRVFGVVTALWLGLYGGFLARSAAERLLSTVYPNGNPPIFVIVLLAAAALTAAGLTKSLARTAEVLMPLLLAIVAVVLLSAAPEVSPANLLPVTYRDWRDILYGAVPIFNVAAAFGYFLFLRGRVVRDGEQRPNRFPWLILLLAVAFGVTFFTLGTLGTNLSITMENAFFMVIRNIRVFGVIERAEAVVVAVWIVTDFIFLSSVLMIAAEIWKTVAGVKRRTFFVLPCAALSGAAAFLIAPDAFALLKWSEFLIPAINLAFTVILIPLALAVGKIRKKY